jgi:hypothetical protein
MAVSKVLSAGLSPQTPMFNPRPICLAFLVDKVALGQDFSEYFGFPLSVSFYQHSITTYFRCCVMSAIDDFRYITYLKSVLSGGFR